MLKVKDNINLDILKKYDFTEQENWWIFHDYSGDGNRKLYIHKEIKTLAILNFGPYSLSNCKLDVIYDLIHDGILEKVPDDEGKFNKDYKKDFEEERRKINENK